MVDGNSELLGIHDVLKENSELNERYANYFKTYLAIQDARVVYVRASIRCRNIADKELLLRWDFGRHEYGSIQDVLGPKRPRNDAMSNYYDAIIKEETHPIAS